MAPTELYALSHQLLQLLNHFLKLRAKHVHLAAHHVAPQGNVQPVSLLALDDEFVGLRNVQWFGLREAGSAINYRQSTSGFPNLLVNNLDLFVDDLAGLGLAKIEPGLSGTRSRGEPLLKRLLALVRSSAGKDALNTDIFI